LILILNFFLQLRAKEDDRQNNICEKVQLKKYICLYMFICLEYKFTGGGGGYENLLYLKGGGHEKIS
jgi:hypothetical protein